MSHCVAPTSSSQSARTFSSTENTSFSLGCLAILFHSTSFCNLYCVLIMCCGASFPGDYFTVRRIDVRVFISWFTRSLQSTKQLPSCRLRGPFRRNFVDHETEPDFPSAPGRVDNFSHLVVYQLFWWLNNQKINILYLCIIKVFFIMVAYLKYRQGRQAGPTVGRTFLKKRTGQEGFPNWVAQIIQADGLE